MYPGFRYKSIQGIKIKRWKLGEKCMSSANVKAHFQHMWLEADFLIGFFGRNVLVVNLQSDLRNIPGSSPLRE